jgi:hypothetical protein
MNNSITDTEQAVQGQLEAYNARDIDTFMTFWADDAEYLVHPSTLLAKGLDEIRERHIVRFQEPNLFGKLISRTVVGNMVVDIEAVSRTFPEGPGKLDAVCIYEVNEGKIAKAWFIIGNQVLDK